MSSTSTYSRGFRAVGIPWLQKREEGRGGGGSWQERGRDGNEASKGGGVWYLHTGCGADRLRSVPAASPSVNDVSI